MFRSEKCSHQIMHCANHDQNMINLITIETTSRGSFNYDQMRHVQNGGWPVAKTPNWGYYKANFLLEMGIKSTSCSATFEQLFRFGATFCPSINFSDFVQLFSFLNNFLAF